MLNGNRDSDMISHILCYTATEEGKMLIKLWNLGSREFDVGLAKAKVVIICMEAMQLICVCVFL